MDIAEITRKAADKCGFNREVYVDANLPTLLSNIVVLPFFGDTRSTCVASSLILRRYKESRTNKYLILCTWPGHRSLFPYVDEYWSVRDQAALSSLASEACGFYNRCDLVSNYHRMLNNYFDNIIEWQELSDLYDQGFGPKYWNMFKDVKVYLPDVPSSTNLPEDVRLGMGKKNDRKIVLFPCKKLDSWQSGRLHRLLVHRDFWCAVTERLLSEGFTPVIYQNHFTYDLSIDFTDRCIWLSNLDVGKVMSAMRWSDCVLDIHSGVSRLATAARCPSLIVDERKRYVETKNYELDDLTNVSPRHYVFSFSTMLMGGGITEWNTSLLDGIVSRLNKWLPTLDRSAGMPPAEYYGVADYDKVRRHKAKRLGVRFIKKK